VFAAQVTRPGYSAQTGELALTGLLDAIVDRLADILERIQGDVDSLSRDVFANDRRKPSVGFEGVLKRLGRDQGLVARARESLVSITRLLSFLGRSGEQTPNEILSRNVKTLVQDVASLSDHTS